MYLKEEATNHLVEILSLQELFDPLHPNMSARYHYVEEVQGPEIFAKKNLAFLSGEALSQCWLNTHYRDHEIA
jgi:hypothetical protein|tara:strand:+ start:887 stop:1105 length:219 start_codon:yes stop_codon:yes gene_type:complete